MVLCKDQGVSYFECGTVKINWTQDEPEPVSGFIPAAERLGTQVAAEAGEDKPDVPPQYRKVFRGRLPGYGPKPKD